jgi:ribosomal protein L7Ae-like RNA K-turn-binding protein
LIARAGKLASGEDGALAMIRSGGAGLVLLDEEAGPNTRKRFEDACAFRNVALLRVPPGSLGQAIGKSARKVAAVASGAMADKLKHTLSAGVGHSSTSFGAAGQSPALAETERINEKIRAEDPATNPAEN